MTIRRTQFSIYFSFALTFIFAMMIAPPLYSQANPGQPSPGSTAPAPPPSNPGTASASNVGATNPNANTGGDAAAKPKDPSRPIAIRNIYALDCKSRDSAGLGDEILVVLSDPCPKGTDTVHGDRLYLFFDQVRMSAISMDWTSSDSLHFFIARDPVKDTIWNAIYAKRCGETTPVDISVGRAVGGPITSEHGFTLILIRKCTMLISYVYFLFVVIALWFLGKKSSLLRDDIGTLTPGQKHPWEIPEIGPSFSLSRVQLAYWTVIVTSCYVFIYLVTRNVPTLIESTLMLLGISMGSTGAAKMVDVSKKDNPNVKPEPSQGFWIDILSDDSGVSMHRFQIVLWDIILGVMYLLWTFSKISLMDLSPTQLTLLGISSATYVGLKIGEKNESTSTPQAPKTDPPTDPPQDPPAPPQQPAQPPAQPVPQAPV